MNLLSFVGHSGLLIFLIVPLIFLLLPLMAIISILRNEFKGNDKLIWVLVVIFLPILGSLLYFLMGRSQKL